MTTAEIGLGVVVAVMGGGNLWNWLASRGKTKIDLITLSQTISADIIAALKADRDALTQQVSNLKDEIADLRHDVKGLSQHIVSLEAIMIQAGITPPPRPARKKAE